MEKIYDVAIIGAGPAGLTAGLYCARAGLDSVIIEKSAVGGLASTTSDIENYPGIKHTDGFSLCYTMMEQCQTFGISFEFEEVISLSDMGDGLKTLALSHEKIIRCKRVILTSGATPRMLAVEGESEFIGRGVSYCATCDGNFFKGKTVAVIGGGNTAVEDALYLEKLASKVYLIHRRDELRADRILAQRLENSAVTPIWNSIVAKINGTDKVTEIILKDVKNDTLTPLSVDGIFVAVGQKPNSRVFDGLELDASGYVLTDEEMRTNLDGIFCAGDVRSKTLRQVITACADGAIAADAVAKELL